MSKFPVEKTDKEGIIDAVNYLLSGPGGLGQNFQGFSSWTKGYLTGNYRPPFTVASTSKAAVGNETEFTVVVTPDYNGIKLGYLATGNGVGTGAVVTGLNFVAGTGYIVTLDVANAADIDNNIIFSPPVAQIPEVYVAPIALGVSEMLDEYTWKYFFASPQATPPFSNGQGVTITGVADSYYDGTYTPIGVAVCTTEYVILKTDAAYAVEPPSSGGTADFELTVPAEVNPGSALPNSTDCNAKVTVNSATDRVFLSAQLNNIISYEATTSTDLQYTVQINRYKGFINNDPINPEYRFNLDQTIAQKVYTFDSLNGTGTLDNVETIFTAIIDQPPPAFYWYILEVEFAETNGGDLQVTQSEFDQRSFSAQVVKQ